MLINIKLNIFVLLNLCLCLF